MTTPHLSTSFDTLWMLCAAILVFIMQQRFGFPSTRDLGLGWTSVWTVVIGFAVCRIKPSFHLNAPIE